MLLGMTPQEGERMPKQGGNLVFDNRFEAEEHKVTCPDTESCDMLCAGSLRLMRIRGWADRDGTVSVLTSCCPMAKGEGQTHISSPLPLLSGTQIASQKLPHAMMQA